MWAVREFKKLVLCTQYVRFTSIDRSGVADVAKTGESNYIVGC